MTIPSKQIRAVYGDRTIRVYQAYSDPIADTALDKQTFVSPPYSMTRMTWIKPSFIWMMYRAGWGMKDDGQKRILAIDMTHEGFAWALQHSCGSRMPDGMTRDEWADLKSRTPVRIQWDPERDLHFNPLSHRAIQIGLRGEAVERYVADWIVSITEVTALAREIHERVQANALEEARQLCPRERAYEHLTDHERYGTE